MDFSAAIEKQLRGETVRVARLAELQFKTATMRLWPGVYPLTTSDGRKWQPTMGVGQVTGLEQSIGGTAPKIEMELSGVDPAFMAKAVAAKDEYFRRKVLIYWQFFDEEWQPIHTPIAITWGRMHSLTSIRRATEKGTMQIVKLSAETPFDVRARARFSYLTDTDQKARHPGDEICSRIAGIESKVIKFLTG